MKRKLFVLFVLSLAIVLVKSESSVEVDENGNEYDVKRFNIEGRQLNGQSHCVVSRRRRATPMYNTDDADEENQESNVNVKDSVAQIYTSPKDEVSAAAPTATVVPDRNTDEETDEEDDLHDSALAAQYHSGVQIAAVAAATADNGIVVVHSHDPPKVNGQTHAIFELLPVHPEDGAVDFDLKEPYDYFDDGDILQVEEEDHPVSTTAVWSTGVGDDLYDDIDRTTKKPKNKKKPSVSYRPSRRPIKNKTNSKKGNKKNKMEKRPIKKRLTQRRPVYKDRRPQKRRPVQSNANRRVVMKNRNKNRNSFQQQNGNRRINANLNHQNRNRKKNKPKEDKDTYTSTMTQSYTDDGNNGNDNRDRDVNCIIINKEPTTTTSTTTTPRPFWNILGRDAGNLASTNAQYGNRKRVGIRFVA